MSNEIIFSNAAVDRSIPINAVAATKSEERLALCGTFTLEPLGPSLQHWLQQLGLSLPVSFCGYSQVFQELIAPNGLNRRGAGGINLLLIRWEDFIRNVVDAPNEPDRRAAVMNAGQQQLLKLLAARTRAFAAPLFVFSCPSSPGFAAEHAELLGSLGDGLRRGLASCGEIHCVDLDREFRRYDLAGHHDARRDELGHLPYTPMAYDTMGTIIARKVFAHRRECRAVVLGCDGVLWRREHSGSAAIDSRHATLQSFMLARWQQGLLLCVSGRASDDAVWNQADGCTGMLLRRPHLAAARLNDRSTAENIREIARELNLDPRQVVYVATDRAEIVALGTILPEVTGITLPSNGARLPRFLEHLWLFDTSDTN